MAERELLPGEYAILGFLADEPLHGYDIARRFKQEGLYEVCPVEQSLLYQYLRNLENRGLVQGSEERVGRRPPRRLFELSERGQETFKQWLHRPVARMRDVRIAFLLKLFFLRKRDVAGATALLERQVVECEAYVARWKAADRSDEFRRLVADAKLSAAQATRDWLQRYAIELQEART